MGQHQIWGRGNLVLGSGRFGKCCSRAPPTAACLGQHLALFAVGEWRYQGRGEGLRRSYLLFSSRLRAEHPGRTKSRENNRLERISSGEWDNEINRKSN